MIQNVQPATGAAYEDPSRNDYFDFLIRCYFGEGGGSLQLCVRRAYLDLNRTLHGFARHGRAGELRDSAHQVVANHVANLPGLGVISQQSFDTWHRAASLS
jgi:hypothetical protein